MFGVDKKTLHRLQKMPGYRGSDIDTLVRLVNKNNRYISTAGYYEPPFFCIVTCNMLGGEEMYFTSIKDAIQWELGYVEIG